MRLGGTIVNLLWVLFSIKPSFFTANKLTSLPIESLIWLYGELVQTKPMAWFSVCVPSVRHDLYRQCEKFNCNLFDVPSGLYTTIGFRRWKMGPLILFGASRPCEWFLDICFLITLCIYRWTNTCTCSTPGWFLHYFVTTFLLWTRSSDFEDIIHTHFMHDQNLSLMVIEWWSMTVTDAVVTTLATGKALCHDIRVRRGRESYPFHQHHLLHVP